VTLPGMSDLQMDVADEVLTDAERFIRGEGPPPLDVPETEDTGDDEERVRQRKAALRALYGDLFPLSTEEEAETEDWVRWCEALWTKHEPGKRTRMHIGERNRLMRQGVQWISSTNLEKWREPPKPKDAARVVNNLIGPALDQRVQILGENRPGFKTRPVTQDPDDIRKAEAQQIALEYQYDQQGMRHLIREAAYWCGTDGVAFWLTYWDPDAGPWHEEMAVDFDGNPVLDSEGQPLSEGSFPMGDVRTRTLRLDQVCVSANATATMKPTYWVIRERIPLSLAVASHGAGVAEAATHASGESQETATYDPPLWSEMFEEQDTVLRYTVFCEPSEFLPQGLLTVTVGDKVVYVGDLPCGVVPMVRFTDGSSDPNFYPRPIMDDWVDHQVRINVLLSRWVDSVRINSGGRFFAKPKALSHETLVGGLHSIIEVRGTGNIAESVQAVPNFSVGQDVKELLASELAAFEAKSGWSQASRGQFSSDASGRAILAAREALERVFSDPVAAAAQAMTEWGKVSLAWMRWGYDLPRTLGVMGTGRPDLARAVSSEDLDGAADVEVMAETLMPMPSSLKLFMLDQNLEKGIISTQEYRQRMPFAYIRDMQTPDTDHFARARRVAEAIRQGAEAPVVKWQDNEAIHQDVLEREIILRDDLDPNVVAVAEQRWMALAQQAQMKMGGAPPEQPQPGAPPGGPGGDSAFQPSPQNQPLPTMNPGIAAAPVALTDGFTEEMMGQSLSFDATRPN
jgi:hypothetical protein